MTIHRSLLALSLLAACAAPPPPAPPALPTAAGSAPSAVAGAAPSASAVPSAVASAAPSAVASAAPREDAEPAPTPLPDGFVGIPEGGGPCGAFRVEEPKEPGWGELTFVRVRAAGGKVVYEAHGRTEKAGTDTMHQTLGANYCGDLTGDGVPELVMTESSMGAHCCYTYYVVSLTTPPKRILMWQKGDAATSFRPVKYRPGPAWQLQGYFVFWPPFTEAGDPVLSYASAPVVPVVLTLVNGAYALTSLSFPEAYRKDRDELRARCGVDPYLSADACDLYGWLDAVAIGDWAQERSKIKDAGLGQALDKRAAATRRKLEKELGSMARPVTPR
jgi:hypothetical protein